MGIAKRCPTSLFIADGGRKMSTRFSVSLLLVLAFSTPVFSQNPQSDPRAINLATKAITALTSGSAISDVRLTANIEWIAGPKPEPGTGIFLAKGNSESRIDLSLNSFLHWRIAVILDLFSRTSAKKPGMGYLLSTCASIKRKTISSRRSSSARWISTSTLLRWWC